MIRSVLIQSHMTPDGAGNAGIFVQTYVVRGNTSLNQIQGEFIQPTIACQLETSPVPGTDIGFTYRDYCDDNLGRILYRRRKIQSYLADTALDHLSLATCVLDSDPDSTSATIGNSQLTLLENFARKRRKGLELASEANFGLGYFTPLIPADSYTVNSCDLLAEIQRHMLEPIVDGGLSWTVWTKEQVQGFLNERINRFLLETGLIRTQDTLTATTPGSVYDLPGDIIDAPRRINSANGVLSRIDKWAADGWNQGWPTTQATDPPVAYVTGQPDPLSITLVPTYSGVIDPVTIQYVATPEPIEDACVVLPIPSMFCPFIKYGVMADMLKCEGETNDPKRAAYCEMRFQEGIQLAKGMVGFGSGNE